MFKAFLLSTFLLMHPLHVSLVTLNHDNGSDTLKMLFRMYYDDFLLDYKSDKPDFDSGKINDPNDYFRNIIGAYLNARVQIYINGKLTDGNVSDLSINGYEVLMNVTYPSDKPPRSIRIRNKVLTSIYSDQANMVYLRIDGYENAVKLTPDNVETTIKIKQ
jgi:hypothetical protein